MLSTLEEHFQLYTKSFRVVPDFAKPVKSLRENQLRRFPRLPGVETCFAAECLSPAGTSINLAN
jgi:ERCC4-type nuclease